MTALLLPVGAQAGDLMLELHGDGLKGQALVVAVFDSEADRFMQKIRIEANADRSSLLIPNLPLPYLPTATGMTG